MKNMREPTATRVLMVFGVALAVLGTAAYLIVNNSFDEEDFEFDTHDELSDDYL